MKLLIFHNIALRIKKNSRYTKVYEKLQILKIKGSIRQTGIQCSGLLRENGPGNCSVSILLTIKEANNQNPPQGVLRMKSDDADKELRTV